VINLDYEPRIALYAQSEIPLSSEGIGVLKDKFSYLLDARFKPSEPEASNPFMTMFEVAKVCHCTWATVARMSRDGRLHPVMLNDEPWFERKEVERVRARH
jgi:hypothetical protein